MKLPGIGRYTSSAIASIAFGQKIPAVDGNLLRIFSRLQSYEDNIKTPAALKEASSFYLSRMPDAAADETSLDAAAAKNGRPGNSRGDFNQALMDLGTAVCLPGSRPACEKCPVAVFCRIHNEKPGREMTLPVMRNDSRPQTPCQRIARRVIRVSQCKRNTGAGRRCQVAEKTRGRAPQDQQAL